MNKTDANLINALQIGHIFNKKAMMSILKWLSVPLLVTILAVLVSTRQNTDAQVLKTVTAVVNSAPVSAAVVNPNPTPAPVSSPVLVDKLVTQIGREFTAMARNNTCALSEHVEKGLAVVDHLHEDYQYRPLLDYVPEAAPAQNWFRIISIGAAFAVGAAALLYARHSLASPAAATTGTGTALAAIEWARSGELANIRSTVLGPAAVNVIDGIHAITEYAHQWHQPEQDVLNVIENALNAYETQGPAVHNELVTQASQGTALASIGDLDFRRAVSLDTYNSKVMEEGKKQLRKLGEIYAEQDKKFDVNRFNSEIDKIKDINTVSEFKAQISMKKPISKGGVKKRTPSRRILQ